MWLCQLLRLLGLLQMSAQNIKYRIKFRFNKPQPEWKHHQSKFGLHGTVVNIIAKYNHI